MADWRIVPRPTRDLLGEGPLWSACAGAMLWVDIHGFAINRLRLSDGVVDRIALPEQIGWLVERRSGGFIAGLRSGFVELELDPLAIRPIADSEPDLPGNRMNDGKADRLGRIWCGTMDDAEQATSGSLYRLDPDLRWTRLGDGYRVPNGPAFSADGAWLYHSDTALRTVFRFPLSEAGDLGAREPFIRFADEAGYPDGMTVDSEGGLWIAHWGGSRISRFLPDGSLDRAIALPARQVTSVAFGGAAMDRMFVTSAAIGLGSAPGEGALFEVFAGVTGVPPHLFDG